MRTSHWLHASESVCFKIGREFLPLPSSSLCKRSPSFLNLNCQLKEASVCVSFRFEHLGLCFLASRQCPGSQSIQNTVVSCRCGNHQGGVGKGRNGLNKGGREAGSTASQVCFPGISRPFRIRARLPLAITSTDARCWSGNCKATFVECWFNGQYAEHHPVSSSHQPWELRILLLYFHCVDKEPRA